jgi:hypothetical protein
MLLESVSDRVGVLIADERRGGLIVFPNAKHCPIQLVFFINPDYEKAAEAISMNKSSPPMAGFGACWNNS